MARGEGNVLIWVLAAPAVHPVHLCGRHGRKGQGTLVRSYEQGPAAPAVCGQGESSQGPPVAKWAPTRTPVPGFLIQTGPGTRRASTKRRRTPQGTSAAALGPQAAVGACLRLRYQSAPGRRMFS